MTKRMIPALLACCFGAALSTACDPQSLTKPQIDIVPTFGSNDDLAGPGSCSEAETQQACSGTLTCQWSNDRCVPMSFSFPS